MNFGMLFKALDTLVVLRDTAKRLKGEPPAPADTGLTAPPPGAAGSIEARLTVFWILQIPVDIALAVFSWRVRSIAGITPAARRFWTVLGISAAGISVGDTTHTLQISGDPTIADIGRHVVLRPGGRCVRPHTPVDRIRCPQRPFARVGRGWVSPVRLPRQWSTVEVRSSFCLNR